jgi:hypothetical protein
MCNLLKHEIYFVGAVGLPFKYVNFRIGNYNAYVDGEYEVIAEGCDGEVKVTEGKRS